MDPADYPILAGSPTNVDKKYRPRIDYGQSAQLLSTINGANHYEIRHRHTSLVVRLFFFFLCIVCSFSLSSSTVDITRKRMSNDLNNGLQIKRFVRPDASQRIDQPDPVNLVTKAVKAWTGVPNDLIIAVETDVGGMSVPVFVYASENEKKMVESSLRTLGESGILVAIARDMWLSY